MRLRIEFFSPVMVLLIFLVIDCTDYHEIGIPGGPGGNDLEISLMQFGEDAYSNGDIPNPTTTFSYDEDEVYYLVKFDLNFGARKRIRKRWIRDSQELFSAIQIVEEDDGRIFGIFKKHDQTSLGSGNYVLQIEIFDDGNYDVIPNNTQTTGFDIQTSALQPYANKLERE